MIAVYMGVWWRTYNRNMGIVFFPSFFFFLCGIRVQRNCPLTKLFLVLDNVKVLALDGSCQTKAMCSCPLCFVDSSKDRNVQKRSSSSLPSSGQKPSPIVIFFSKEKVSLRNRDDDGWSSRGAKLCRGKSLETYRVSLTYGPESRDSVLSPS